MATLPVNSSVSLQQAYSLFLSRRFEESLLKIERVLALEVNTEYAWYIKGLLYFELKDYAKSIHALSEAMRLNPTDVSTLKALANALYCDEQYLLAFEQYSHSLKYAGSDWVIFSRMGECKAKMDRFEESIEYFEKSLSVQRHEETYLHLARILTIKGQDDQALVVLEEAVKLSEEHSDVLVQMSILNAKKGDAAKAKEMLEQALTQNSQHQEALKLLAELLVREGKSDEAVEKYQTLLRLDKTNSTLWKDLGMCYFQKKKYLMATSLVEKALDLDPSNVSILYTMGLCSYYIDRKLSSYRCLSLCLERDPKHEPALSLLEKVLNDIDPPLKEDLDNHTDIQTKKSF